MRGDVTAEQFRLVWARAGGDAVPMPIQAPSRGRMISDRDRIGRELDAWWAANEDPELYAAVRGLRRAPALLHLEGHVVGGGPLRGLLGAGGMGLGGMGPGGMGAGSAVLANQEAIAAVRAADSRDWFADTAIDTRGFSLERGGNVLVSVGRRRRQIEKMVSATRPFTAGGTPALRGSDRAADGAEYTSRASTTSKSERISALLARPRTQRGIISASVVDGVGWREVGRFDWIVVAGDGGYLVESGAAGVRPAGRDDLAAAAHALLASAEAVASREVASAAASAEAAASRV